MAFQYSKGVRKPDRQPDDPDLCKRILYQDERDQSKDARAENMEESRIRRIGT